VNHNATVDHDCDLRDGLNLCPGAHLAGRVACRDDAFIGIGAVIVQGITVGERAIVGAGAVVIDNVPDDVGPRMSRPASSLRDRSWFGYDDIGQHHATSLFRSGAKSGHRRRC
jgi:serine acetyltransferase